MRFLRDLRLIPVVALAASALFVLKATSLIVEGGYTLIASRAAMAQGMGQGGLAPPPAIVLPPPTPLEDTRPAPRGDRASATGGQSWVRDIYDASSALNASTNASSANAPISSAPTSNAPIAKAANTNADNDITGSVAAVPKPEAAAAAKPEAPAAEPPKDAGGHGGGGHGGGGHGAAPAPDKNISTTPPEPLKPQVSAGERAVLESLQQRRQELDTRSREIEVSDSLLKAAEKRIEGRLQELKEMEARLNSAEKKKEDDDSGKFKTLVTMYENMKPKDAAKIFDRLTMPILVEVVNAMNPRKMSDVLGLMSPEIAEKLTVEIANRSGALGKTSAGAELPKIEGRPNRM